MLQVQRPRPGFLLSACTNSIPVTFTFLGATSSLTKCGMQFNMSVDKYIKQSAQRTMAVVSLKQSSTETAYGRLRDELFQGTLKPGQRLSEPELALRFTMSRSPIREALVRLEHEGFIERTVGGAARVKALNIEEFEQLYVLRATVEGLATRL